MIRFHDILGRFRRDEGIGLVEVMVAVGVLFVALLALAYTATVALNDIGLSRQRQGASAIANDLMEQVRAMNFEEIEAGLNTADLQAGLSDDENVLSCTGDPAGTYRFRDCSGEPVVHSAPSSRAPLHPYQDTVQANASPTAYDRAVYITRPADDPDAPAGTYRAIVVVEWDQRFRPGTSTRIQSQTLLFNPSGCPDAGLTPVGAPCPPQHFASSITPQGSIQIQGTIDGSSVDLTVGLVGARSDVQTAQGRFVQGDALASGVSGAQTAGGATASSTADDADPYETQELNAPAWNAQAALGALTLSSGTSQGRSTSTTAAGVAGDCPRPAGAPPLQAQTDGEPCGHSWVEGGALTANLGLQVGGFDLQAMLFSASADPVQTVADFEHQAGLDGLVQASTARELSDIRLLGLPSALGGPDFLIQIEGYRGEVQAQAGTGTSEPSANITAGTFRYWNPSTGSYTAPIPLDAPSQTVNLDTEVSSSILGLGLVSARLSGSFTTGGPGTTFDPDVPGPVRYSARAELDSPITGTFNYRIRSGGITVVDLTINVNLGNLVADAKYQESAGA